MASNIEGDISHVISELSKIDDAAESVLTHIESDKQAYDNKIKKDIAKFDTELEDNIRTQLAQFEADIRQANAKELDIIRRDTKQTIAGLEVWYDKNHSSIAKEIVNDFIKE